MVISINTKENSGISITEMFFLNVYKELKGDVSYKEIIYALPELKLKEDTVYRILKKLHKKNLIDLKTDDKDLYLMGDSDCSVMKIGISNNPKKRLKNIMTSNPMDINILYISKRNSHREAEAHFKFKDIRLSGEWFKYDERIINWFNSL